METTKSKVISDSLKKFGNYVKELFKNPNFLIPFIVISLVCVFRIVYFCFLDICFTNDSYEYILRDGFAWLHGEVDRFRLPLYPMLINICRFIAGEGYAIMICVMQLLISLFGVVVLYLAIRKITPYKWIGLSIIILYATYSAISGWDKTMLTESLSLSLMIFVLFTLVSFVKEPRLKYVIITTICLTLGCLLRAVFLIYAGLYFGFLIIYGIVKIVKFRKESDKEESKKIKKVSLRNASIAIIPLLVMTTYATMFKVNHKAFTLSDSGLGQHLTIVLENDFYEENEDYEIKDAADKIIKAETIDEETTVKLHEYVYKLYGDANNYGVFGRPYLARIYILETFERSRIDTFVKQSLKTHFGEYLGLIPNHLFDNYRSYNEAKDNDAAKNFVRHANTNYLLPEILIIHTLIISVVELGMFVWNLMKKKEEMWIRIGLGTIMLSTILLALFGTNSEYPRTSITVLPCAFIACCFYFDSLTRNILELRIDKKPNKILN